MSPAIETYSVHLKFNHELYFKKHEEAGKSVHSAKFYGQKGFQESTNLLSGVLFFLFLNIGREGIITG